LLVLVAAEITNSSFNSEGFYQIMVREQASCSVCSSHSCQVVSAHNAHFSALLLILSPCRNSSSWTPAAASLSVSLLRFATTNPVSHYMCCFHNGILSSSLLRSDCCWVVLVLTQMGFSCLATLSGWQQGVVDQRMSEGPDNWRLVYKTLLLLEYMLKHGPLVRWKAVAVCG
jgi:hypothetical protein